MSEEEDWEEVIDIPKKGVYQVKYHRLSLKALKNKKSRLLGKAAGLRRNIIANNIANAQYKRELDHLDKINLDDLVVIETAREAEAHSKAEQFLKSWIGEANFKELETKGAFKFTANNGKHYRIKQNGQLQEDGGHYWINLCTIKPSLPMPDIIAATFSAVKNNRQELFGSTVKRQTDEEVTK